jgi:hypothetical protein
VRFPETQSGTVRTVPREYAEQAPGVSQSAYNVLHSRFGD